MAGPIFPARRSAEAEAADLKAALTRAEGGTDSERLGRELVGLRELFAHAENAERRMET
jgi:hypothetical protein